MICLAHCLWIMLLRLQLRPLCRVHLCTLVRPTLAQYTLACMGTHPTHCDWSSSVGAIAAPHLYRSLPAGICPELPGHRAVLPAPPYGWPPYAIGTMPYVGDGLFRPAINHYTDTAISNDLSRLTLDHYSAAAAVHLSPQAWPLVLVWCLRCYLKDK